MALEARNGHHLNGNGYLDHAGSNGLVVLASPDELVARRIAAYRTRFHDRPNGGLFSERTSGETPLLIRFDQELGRRPRRVIEAGAGPGTQAIDLARTDQRLIIAVEPNAEYTGIRQRIAGPDIRLGAGSRIELVEDDVIGHLRNLPSGSIDGIHANSLVHFWTPQVRVSFYEEARRVLAREGVLAVSLKTVDDAQRGRGTVVDRDEIGIYELDPDYPDLTRVFVENTKPLEEELGQFRIAETLRWRVGPYDFPDEPEKEADFVAFLARPV